MNDGSTVSRRATLKQLRAFCEVAERGGFNAAAQALHATQPAVSGYIRQLERALGVLLIERTTRSVALTPAGRELLPRLRSALADMDAVLIEVCALAREPCAHVAIAAAGSVVTLLLAPVVAALRESHPHLTLRVIETSGQHVRRLVQSGEVSFGMTTLDGCEPELDARPLLSDRFGALMAKHHPLAYGERALNWSMLAGETLVELTEENCMRRLFDDSVAFRANAGPRIEVPTVHAAVALAAQGGSIAVLPALCAHAFGTPSTVFHPVDGPEIWRSVGVVRRRGAVISVVEEQIVRSLGGEAEALAFSAATRSGTHGDALHLRLADMACTSPRA